MVENMNKKVNAKQDNVKENEKIMPNKESAFLQQIFSCMPGSVYWKDRNGIYRDCNDEAAQLFGLSRNEIIGKTDYDFEKRLGWPKEIAESFVKIDQEVMKTGIPRLNYEELPFHIANGKTIVQLTNKVPLRDENNQIIGVLGISIDITEQKKTEENLQIALQKLEKTNAEKLKLLSELNSEVIGESANQYGTPEEYVHSIRRYLQDIIACMPGHVYWMDKNCVYLGGNDNVAKMMGLKSPKEIRGVTYDVMAKLSGWTEGQANSFRNDDLEVMRTGQAKLNVEEPPIPDHNGNPVYFLTSRVPIFDENKQVLGVVGISIDITDRKKMEEQLRIAMQQAEAASQAKTDFIANMSHDLRTPITGILGLAQDLLSTAQESDAALENDTSSDLKESTQRFIHHVKNDSVAVINTISPLLNLFNEILESIRLGKGVSSQSPESFDAYELIEHNVALLQPTARHKKVDLITNIDKRVPQYISGFRNYIDRTLINLISNALKFTEEGFVKVSMRLSEDTPASYKKGDKIKLEISIQDTGIGIPKEKHDVIFEHFSRLNASHEGIYKGSGLGLYTVKVYIQAMKGKIKIESEPGNGTNFIITLPFIVSDKADRPRDTSFSIPVESLLLEKKTHIPFSTSSSPDKNNLSPSCKILIVEDNPTAARALLMSVKPFNCSVDIAENGAQAIEKAQNNSYDIILMDVGLPDISGIEATKTIRSFSDAKKAQVPIVAITGHADTPEIQKECIDAGMQDVLSKPARPLLLQAVFQRFVFDRANKDVIPEISSPNKSLILKNIAALVVMDWEASKRMCGDDWQHLFDLLVILVGDLAVSCTIISKALEEKDVPVIRPELHRIIGGIVYICAPRLEAAAKTFQKAIKAETPDWDECKRLYRYLLETIEAFRKECEKGVNLK